jgi:hypothetical protein
MRNGNRFVKQAGDKFDRAASHRQQAGCPRRGRQLRAAG